MIQSVGQIAIRSRDLETDIAFYRDALGLRFLFRAPPGLAFFEVGETRLMLSTEGATSLIYYRVEDIQAAYADLRAKEAHLIDEPHLIARLADRELWMFFVEDPSGNTVGLMAEPPV